MNLHKLSDTSKVLLIYMTDAAGTAQTGKTVAATLSKNGGAFASASGTVAEVGSGVYKLTPASGDVDTLGPLVLRGTATGCVDFVAPYRVVAFDPYAATNLGLSALPTATAGGTGGLVTAATDVSGSQVPGSAGAAWRSVNDNLAGLVTTVGTAGAGLSDIPKTGFKLASDGLDSIAVTAPTGVASTFPGMVVQTWRRFFAKATKTSTQIKTYANDGTTVVTTQTVSDDGSVQTQGAAS